MGLRGKKRIEYLVRLLCGQTHAGVADVIGAAIQEEIIFRGLLQTTLARRVPATLSFFGSSVSYAAIIVALLFGLIHLEVNPITAAAAFVLGLFSGELRHRSGSLLPAILVHAVFNAFAAIL